MTTMLKHITKMPITKAIASRAQVSRSAVHTVAGPLSSSFATISGRFSKHSLVPSIRSAPRSKASFVTASAKEVAADGDYVEVNYTGWLDDGAQFDSSLGREPLPFTVGAGRVVKGFEKIVRGMAVGETRKERLTPDLAYGEWREQMTAKIPVDQAPEGLSVGVMVQLQNGMTATVTEVDNEFITIDANPPLAGQALTFEVELVKLTKATGMKQASFGAGCFWSVELNFQRLPGVVTTEVGYSQGANPKVTYEEVCGGNTGHVEVVNVTYDENEIPFEALLESFFDKHDPTQLNRQGNDSGTQYRSGIYYTTEDQREVAERVLQKMQEKYSGQVVTELEPLKNYCKAEEYHQQYLEKGGRNGNAQSAAKGCKDPIRCYG